MSQVLTNLIELLKSSLLENSLNSEFAFVKLLFCLEVRFVSSFWAVQRCIISMISLYSCFHCGGISIIIESIILVEEVKRFIVLRSH